MANAKIIDAIEHYWCFHDYMTARNPVERKERAAARKPKRAQKAVARKVKEPRIKKVYLKPKDPNFDVWAWKALKEAKDG